MRNRLFPLLAILAAGCDGEAASPMQPTSEPPPIAIGTEFNPATAGTVTGRVTWKGPLPLVPEFPHHVPQPDGSYAFRTAENPNRPQINPKNRAVAGVVVRLEGIDPKVARPWDLPPVSVVVGESRITVVQGGERRRVGFVRRGDSVTVASVEPMYHILRGRGDAFFSLTLPKPDQPVTRALSKAGRVELSSGSGQYWASADLFVAEYPYFTVTDASGRFTLGGVPPGRWKLTAWMPGWEGAKMERDPDSTVVTRMTYSPPVEQSLSVEPAPGQSVEVHLTLP